MIEISMTKDEFVQAMCDHSSLEETASFLEGLGVRFKPEPSIPRKGDVLSGHHDMIHGLIVIDQLGQSWQWDEDMGKFLGTYDDACYLIELIDKHGPCNVVHVPRR